MTTRLGYIFHNGKEYTAYLYHDISTKQLGIHLVHPVTKVTECTPTLNDNLIQLAKDEVIVNIGKQDGILLSLIEYKIVQPTGKYAKIGSVYHPICKIVTNNRSI